MYAEKLQSCNNSLNVLELFKELTCTRQIKENTHSNACSLNESFLQYGSYQMLFDHRKSYEYCGPMRTEIEVLECLKALRPSRCPGPDEVPNLLCKKCAIVPYQPLTSLFNEFFLQTGYQKLGRR